MGMFDSSFYTRAIKRNISLSKSSVLRFLQRWGQEVTVTRLTTEEQNKVTRYSDILGKGSTMVSGVSKSLNRTDQFTMRLAILNQGLYSVHNPTEEPIEVVYSDNELKMGDTIELNLWGNIVNYRLIEEPKTYYDVAYTANLEPIGLGVQK